MKRLKIFKIYFILWLFIFFLVYANFTKVYTFFMATITFNSAVLTILFIGLIVILGAGLQLTMLTGTFATMRYKKGKILEFYLESIHKDMPENIARMFKNRATKEVLFFTKQEVDDVTTWFEEKFANQKIYINFFISTSLMIGLFGTFTGLLKAIDEMGAIILTLAGDINLSEVIAGFAGPLSGMAIGFGSSLFGVASAIILSVMGYILTRNQEVFVEGVQDWMNAQIIESQNSNVIESMQVSGVSGGAGGNDKMISGVMNIFTDKISVFSEQMEKNNKANEAMFGMLTDSIDNNSINSQNEMDVLERISSSLKEANINQFSNTNMMEESLQEISDTIIVQNKSIKQMIELQDKNNQMIAKLVENMDSRLANLEKILLKK